MINKRGKKTKGDSDAQVLIHNLLYKRNHVRRLQDKRVFVKPADNNTLTDNLSMENNHTVALVTTADLRNGTSKPTFSQSSPRCRPLELRP